MNVFKPLYNAPASPCGHAPHRVSCVCSVGACGWSNGRVVTRSRKLRAASAIIERWKMGCCCFKSNDSDLSPTVEPSQSGKLPKEKNPSPSVKVSKKKKPSPKEQRSPSLKLSKETKPLEKFIVLYDYKAGSKSELNLTKGEIVEEVRDVDDIGPEWVLVSQPGKGTGYAPRAWLAEVGTFEMKDWYFGEMRGIPAEDILRGTPEGTFLVRLTHTRRRKIYILSVSRGETDAIHHRLVVGDMHPSTCKSLITNPTKSCKGPWVYFGGKNFDSMEEMIEFYKKPWKEGQGYQSDPWGLKQPAPKPMPERIELPIDIQKNWQEIPRQQIQVVGKELGEGNFGIVRKGIWKPTDAVQLQVAIKELKKGSTNQREDFLREAVAMKSLIHKHLVKLYGIVSADEPFWIVTEFVKDGALKDFLQKRKKEKKELVEPKLVEISTQIADGMRYLESKHVVHRDLAARNVLVDERVAKTIKETQIIPKIADFGMARMIKSGVFKENRSIDLAIKWMAPEVLEGLRFSTKSDVWSFGIMLHEIFTHGEDPYEGMRFKDVKKKLLKGEFCLKKDPRMPDKMYDLMKSCCEFVDIHRPRFRDIFEGLENFYEGEDPYCKKGE